MKITPLFDRVLLKPVTTQVSQGGIYIPKEAAERSQIMSVVAIGEEVEKQLFKIGDKVIVSKYAGTEVVIDGEKNYVVSKYDILAKEEI